MADQLDSTIEQSFIAAIARMFSRPDFLLPLVAAQRQYRAIHYGLTAAALLEDVFTDAVAFYVRQFEPTHTFERAARGSAEIDYSWDGIPFSHKSGLGPTDVSILWDATVQNATHWSSDYPIAYLSTGYSGTNGTVRRVRGVAAQTILHSIQLMAINLHRIGTFLIAQHHDPGWESKNDRRDKRAARSNSFSPRRATSNRATGPPALV